MLKLLNVSNIYSVSSSNNDSSQSSINHIVLDSLNLDVKEGEFVTITGPFGCGKSELFNIVASIDTL
jgi:ABC-type nitrate/sulfonate/bicarbonate transport system ATPase subunit